MQNAYSVLGQDRLIREDIKKEITPVQQPAVVSESGVPVSGAATLRRNGGDKKMRFMNKKKIILKSDFLSSTERRVL
ncbi:MAG: hypothetical protein HF982_07200 [Desulfobacteraceae bacterium]|nr:hypothetical protein [Desulfobacteraceae bacterium]MBC2719358.1 hypothetical protein [Desulfobacteraceae bacterium]